MCPDDDLSCSSTRRFRKPSLLPRRPHGRFHGPPTVFPRTGIQDASVGDRRTNSRPDETPRGKEAPGETPFAPRSSCRGFEIRS